MRRRRMRTLSLSKKLIKVTHPQVEIFLLIQVPEASPVHSFRAKVKPESGSIKGIPTWIWIETELLASPYPYFDFAIHLPTKPHTHHPVSNGGVLIAYLLV